MSLLSSSVRIYYSMYCIRLFTSSFSDTSFCARAWVLYASLAYIIYKRVKETIGIAPRVCQLCNTRSRFLLILVLRFREAISRRRIQIHSKSLCIEYTVHKIWCGSYISTCECIRSVCVCLCSLLSRMLHIFKARRLLWLFLCVFVIVKSSEYYELHVFTNIHKFTIQRNDTECDTDDSFAITNNVWWIKRNYIILFLI